MVVYLFFFFFLTPQTFTVHAFSHPVSFSLSVSVGGAFRPPASDAAVGQMKQAHEM